MEDKTLTCKECNNPFVFTARDQRFFAEKGFKNEPQRCRDCRLARRAQSPGGGGARPSYEAVCAACNEATTLPFNPRGDRPVYCRSCFTERTPVSV